MPLSGDRSDAPVSFILFQTISSIIIEILSCVSGCPTLPDAPPHRAAAVPCGMSNEKCLRVTGTVRANPRRERQSSHCMSQLHFWRDPDEKPEGSFFLTSTRQKSILRGSEIFGYDEKEYPERMLQRAAGWCKAVQGVRGKILSELSG